MTSISNRGTPFPLHVLLVLGAMAICLPRIWVASQAVAPNRDAIRYWGAADQLFLQPLDVALLSIDCRPLYPALLSFLKWVGWAATPELWWRSTQGLGIACSLLFLAAAFVWGRAHLGERRAAWGCLLVALLPRPIRYSADVLADPLEAALLWGALAVWGTGSRPVSLGRILTAGSLLALATLTRAEAWLWVMVLGGVELVECRRHRSTSRSVRFLVFLSPIVAVALWYGSMRGEFVPGNTARAILGLPTAAERSSPLPLPKEEGSIDRWISPDPTSVGSSLVGLVASGLAAIWELGEETRVLLLAFFLIGAVSLLRGGVDRASLIGGLLVIATIGLLTLCRWKAGFLSSRYYLPILPLVGFGAVQGIDAFVAQWPRCQAWITKLLFIPVPSVASARVGIYGASLLMAIGFALPSVMDPLHQDRWAHRQGAIWLHTHTQPGEAVFDPTWMSAYFSGRPMVIPGWSLGPLPRYAILDEGVVDRPPAELAEAVIWANRGTTVQEIPRRPGSNQRAVRIVEFPSGPMMSRHAEGNVK